MKPKLILCFWLGSLDSRVAAGHNNVGGTHDIRLCSVGEAVRKFVGRAPDSTGRWKIKLETYPEVGISDYKLTIAEYSGTREGECALPGQFKGSSNEYPLWAKLVRPYRSASTKPREAILLLKDVNGKYHARMLHRENVPRIPTFMRRILSLLDECGQLISVPKNYVLIDLPFDASKLDDMPFIVRRASIDRGKEAKRILKIKGTSGKESVALRHRRSRQLAEELKRFYEYNCQLCDGSIPRIHVGGDRYYVEVHHIKGFAEVDPHSGKIGPTQETSDILLDKAGNIVVVCPYHHMVLHYSHGGFKFDQANGRFIGKDGAILCLTKNDHL